MIANAWLGAPLALALWAAGLPVLAQDQAAAPAADTVVATANGTAITLGHMIVMRQSLPEQYQTLPDDVLFQGILDQLVQQVILEQSVAGKITLRDTLALENDRRGYLSGIALQEVATAAVTDAAIEAAYAARFRDAPPQTEWNASHILVDSQEKAAELRAQVDAGADFAELAKANSTDGAAANGGSLGWFGPGMMVKPFEDAVTAMTAGEVSGPIETQFGWHLVKLDETRAAAVPTLDDVRAELAAEVERAAVEAHIAALTASATVTRPGEGIDPATLRDLTLLDK